MWFYNNINTPSLAKLACAYHRHGTATKIQLSSDVIHDGKKKEKKLPVRAEGLLLKACPGFESRFTFQVAGNLSSIFSLFKFYFRKDVKSKSKQEAKWLENFRTKHMFLEMHDRGN